MRVTTIDARIERSRARRLSQRNREAGLLLVVAAVLAVHLWSMVGTITAPFPDLERELASGLIVDLNQIPDADALVPVLARVFPATDRSFVAQRIWHYRQRPGGRPFRNVGELVSLRLSKAEIDDAEEVLSLRTARQDGRESTPLITRTQLREIKPFLVVRKPETFRRALRFAMLLFFLTFGVVHLVWRVRRFEGSPWLLPMVFLLTGIGLAQMLGLRDPLRDQLLFRAFVQGVGLGAVGLLVASQLRYRPGIWRRATFLFLAGGLVLSVLLILFGSGPGTSDAKVNLFGFQPVEAIKILLAFFLAGYFCDRWEFLRELKERRGWSKQVPFLSLPQLEYFVPVVVAMALVLTFFFLQRDLGPALVMSLVFLAIYGTARGRFGLVALGLSIAVLGFYFGYRIGFPSTVASRVGMWRAPWDNAIHGGDHLAMTIWALASGGLTGQGLGQGAAELVPAAHTDMILASIGEEMGFIGLLLIALPLAGIVFVGLQSARLASTHYTFFLALALSLLFAFQMLLIAGGVVGLVPLTGIPTPFLSYGRSAMIANLTAIGVLAAVSAADKSAPPSMAVLCKTSRWLALALILGALAVVAKTAQIQWIQADRLAIRQSLSLQGDGVRRFQTNPRLLRLAERLPRGTIVDRRGVPLATGDPLALAPFAAFYASLDIDLKSLPTKRRMYPFGGETFHLLGDLLTRFQWAASNTSYVERDARVWLQGYDDYAESVRVSQTDGDSNLIRRDYRELVPLLRHADDPAHPEVRSLLERDRTLRLTIDIALQKRVGAILARHATAAGATRGAAVVIDATSGALLASVSWPWPDRMPRASDDPMEPRWLDRARYGVYPPGSAFKVLSAIAALRHDPDLAHRTFRCDRLSGGRVGQRIRGWGRPIRDDRKITVPHGEVDMTLGIRQSCNAYFAQLITLAVGARPLMETAALFDIQVASPNTPEALQDALPQAAFGQGQVTATPLEMARVAATIANSGVMPKIRWLADQETPRPQRVLTAPLAAFIGRAMREVTTRGTARRALAAVVPEVAGKTGTAEVAKGRPHAWFIGFAPFANAPERKIAFSIVIEHGGYGGRSAADASAEIVIAADQLGLLDADLVASNPSEEGSTP